MARDARWHASYEEIERLPETMIGELLDGELVVAPRPALRHALAASALGVQLGPMANVPGGGAPGEAWWILGEPELHLGDDVLVPDLAGWRRERMPKLPDVAACELPPDWVCEILSPGSLRRDRVQKKRIYARAGVGNLWLIDPAPAARTLEAFRLEGARWLEIAVHSGDERAAVPPFEAVLLDLGRLWMEE